MTLSKTHTRPLLIFVLVTSIISTGNAQQGVSNARSVAMGGAYTALARGVEAPAWNPANLALPGRRHHFRLIGVGVGFHNNSFSKKHYDLYNGSVLSQQDKDDILATIPAEGIRSEVDTEVQAFGFAIGPFAFTATGLGASDARFSRDIVDLLLNGNEIDQTYEIGNTDGEGFGYTSFAVSAAFPMSLRMFQRSTFGVSLKYLWGHAYGKVAEASTSFRTEVNGFNGLGQVSFDHALGGAGFGADLGVAAVLNNRWTISMGVSNIFAKINWSNESERTRYAFNADSVTIERIEETDFDSVFINSEETFEIESFSSTLPAELNLGVARKGGLLTLALDFAYAVRKGPGVANKPRVALGGEFRPVGFIPLRAGLAVGGRQGFQTSAGFGFDFSVFVWNFAVASNGAAINGRGLNFAFDWLFRF